MGKPSLRRQREGPLYLLGFFWASHGQTYAQRQSLFGILGYYSLLLKTPDWLCLAAVCSGGEVLGFSPGLSIPLVPPGHSLPPQPHPPSDSLSLNLPLLFLPGEPQPERSPECHSAGLPFLFLSWYKTSRSFDFLHTFPA